MNIDQDKQEIADVITLYFAGSHCGNVQQLETAFHPEARISGFIGDAAQDWSRDEFINRVADATKDISDPGPYDKKILLIENTMNTAMVKARVVVGDLVFLDYISLLKLNGRWVIRHKSFTTI